MTINPRNLMKSVLIIGYLLFINLPVVGLASNENRLAEILKSKLIEHGFENVAVIIKDRQVLVTYENRLYRYEVRAVKEILEIAFPLVREMLSMTLIPQYRKIPLMAITIPVDPHFALTDGQTTAPTASFSSIEASLDVGAIWQKMKDMPKINSSSWRFDIVVHPQFNAQFGNFDDPVKSQINLAPEMTASFWEGMMLSAQVIIPLQNDLREEGNGWRPGLLTFNQVLRLPQNTFVSATLGYFTQQRYGADFEVRKYFRNGVWALGANLGYTGYASYFEDTWKYSRLNFLIALFSADYRFAQFDLTVRARYGKFLYQDKGWRWDIFRQFGEVDIGFFGIRTQIGTNLGFNFSIPIFPPKHLKAGTLRLRTANYFSWEYRYRGILDSGASGYRYKTGNSIDDFLKRLHPDYVKGQLLRPN